jgi:hypothetical protein
MSEHTELVALAARWLERAKLCSVVVTEMSCSAPEAPDALGFRMGCSWLIECKASRADFFADAKKYFRRHPEHGMGQRRFYACAVGVIKPEELPPGWGLLHAFDGRLVEVRASADHDCDRRREVEILTSCVRRMICAPEVRGVRCKTYVFDEGGEPRATVYAQSNEAKS